jgi:hypothetical protein
VVLDELVLPVVTPPRLRPTPIELLVENVFRDPAPRPPWATPIPPCGAGETLLPDNPVVKLRADRFTLTIVEVKSGCPPTT